MMSKTNKCVNTVEKVLVNCPIGEIAINSCSFGLHSISQIGPQITPNTSIKVQLKDQSFVTNIQAINDSIEWLKVYFEKPNDFHDLITPKLCPFEKHSEFYRKVWSTLLNETKFGQKISYTELALKSTGNANSSRAVGTAMKRNPFQLIVPCHRVVKKDGTNGHYSGGHKNDLKDWLLLYEKSFSEKSLH